jgi:glucose/arabinose dehydrogenase
LRRVPGRVLRIAAVALLLGAAAVACCRLLPERYAVNAPLAHLILGRGADPPDADRIGRELAVPDGFAIELYASGLANARGLRFTPSGDLLVTTPRSGRVMLLERDANGDGRPDSVRPLLEGLDRPHGLDFHGDWLYVAESGGVVRVRYDARSRRTAGAPEPIVSGLPEGGNHWTRTLRFGPDGRMYVSIGSSCNACIESDRRRAALLRYQPDGSGEEIVATGLRNAVGFDWQPGSGELYATDNGRDLLGDDVPPCELDRIVPGGFYGWPFAYGARLPDPDLGAGHEAEIAASIPPAHAFRAHNAPLGIAFLRDARWPTAWRGAALVALHGSWNRTRKDGYKVVSLHWSPDGRIEERDFATGFLRDERVIGRPVDVAEGPDGAIYVSDDYAGAIYRIRLAASAEPGEPTAPSAAAAPDSAIATDPLASLVEPERGAAQRQGRALFEAHACARCHDPARAEPGVVAVPLARLATRYDLAGLEAFLAAPAPPMPAFPLTAEDRHALAVFLLVERGR